jgi:hypothetical protein
MDYVTFRCLVGLMFCSSVADPDQFDTDPDPAFQFYMDDPTV